ncbi:MAG: hypothetical protein ACOY5F_08120 [Pseudomonadota bacterium]
MAMIAGRVVSLASLTLALCAAPFAHAEAQPVSSRRPMIFFLAQGSPDACGPGCSQWIAADGVFGPDTLGHLSAFLYALDRSDLPLFFHSQGGSLQAAMAVGRKLRGWRIAAAVGRTVVAGCNGKGPRDPACLVLLQSQEPVSAELQFDGASCASACVSALIGSPRRSVAEQARLGIHAPNYKQGQQWSLDPAAAEQLRRARTTDLLRYYTVRMGIDGSLIDEAEKTPHSRIHWLSRDDMSRFGILGSDGFETAWATVGRPAPMIVKSITRTAPRTTMLRVTCHTQERVRFTVLRELPDDELGGSSEVRLMAGGDVVGQGRDLNDRRDDERIFIVPVAALRRAAIAGLALDETVTAATGHRARSARIGTAGLEEALDRLLTACSALRMPQPAAPKPGRLRVTGIATMAPLWDASYIPAASGPFDTRATGTLRQ